MRKPHLLKDNKTTQLPYNVVFFDCETLPKQITETRIEQVFRLAVAYHVRYETRHDRPTVEVHQSLDTSELWAWITSKATAGKRLYVVAHNAEFDFRVSHGFSTLTSAGWDMTKGLFDAAMFTLFWKREHSTILVVNSYQWLPATIEAIGDIMGIPKKTMPAWEAPTSEWFDYCERDVEILAKAFDAYRTMVREHNLGTFSLTIASQAFNAFRHRFDRAPIYIHNRPTVLELERDAYFGGRVECYRMGTFKSGPYYKLDVNSMYPSVMASCPYPVKLVDYLEGPSVAMAYNLTMWNYTIARCRLSTMAPYYPKRFKNKLMFPTGSFRTVLHRPELLTALCNGHVMEVTELAVYNAGDTFSSYVSTIYGLRRQYADQGNLVFAYIMKLFLNSLYGKFGQRGRETVLVGYDKDGACWQRESYDAKTGQTAIYRCIQGKVWRTEMMGEAYNSFPAIAGAVTSYGRDVLLNLILKAGWDNVFYVDTDSLIVNDTGLDRLEDTLSESQLGGLKVEDKADEMTILGLKRYTFGGDVKNKGIKRSAIEIEPGVFEVEKWRRIRSALEEGDIEHYYIDTVKIHLQGTYDKGVVMSDGTVRPIVLKE